MGGCEAISGMRVIGLAGWSGSDKTTLLVRVIPALVARGLQDAMLKHAHHDFDPGRPSNDFCEHRKADASEVLVSSGRRWAIVRELGNEPEATLAQLLERVSPREPTIVDARSAPPALIEPPTQPRRRSAGQVTSSLGDDPLQRNVVRLRADRFKSPECEADTNGARPLRHRGNRPIIEAAAIAEPVALPIKPDQRHHQEVGEYGLA